MEISATVVKSLIASTAELSTPAAELAPTLRGAVAGVTRTRVTAIIPAFNEAETIGPVIDAARGALLIDDVIVVDNASKDATSLVAARHGARVVQMPVPGKGQAMAAGVASSTSPVIVFLDADLKNLRPDHVDKLVRPVLDGDAVMTMGSFDRGHFTNSLMRRVLPNLAGQRALRRELFESLRAPDAIGWRTEAALNSAAARTGQPRQAFALDGVLQRTKEEKYANPVVGFAQKIKMLGIAGWTSAELSVRSKLGIEAQADVPRLVDSVRGAYTELPRNQ